MKPHLLFGFGLLTSGTLLFGQPYPTPEMLIAFHNAGKHYNINPVAIMTLGRIESGFDPFARNVNRDGSVDVGVMQINSWWLPTLKKYGLYDERRLYDPDYNIFVGAWILKQCQLRHGQSWKTIDCYNKGSGKAKDYGRYVVQFSKHMKEMERLYTSLVVSKEEPAWKPTSPN